MVLWVHAMPILTRWFIKTALADLVVELLLGIVQPRIPGAHRAGGEAVSRAAFVDNQIGERSDALGGGE